MTDPGGDSLLHVGVSFKPLANQVIRKESKEIATTRSEIETVGRVVLNLPAIAL
jgi:hypothetical protein